MTGCLNSTKNHIKSSYKNEIIVDNSKALKLSTIIIYDTILLACLNL